MPRIKENPFVPSQLPGSSLGRGRVCVNRISMVNTIKKHEKIFNSSFSLWNYLSDFRRGNSYYCSNAAKPETWLLAREDEVMAEFIEKVKIFDPVLK
ncbi:MAG: hypothetical protein PF482_19575 [Desulfobacteraceae bacterium]|jgi:hypothetical protein|nr:hypothetical protein [Desulfobacteraceae bacterium]